MDAHWRDKYLASMPDGLAVRERIVDSLKRNFPSVYVTRNLQNKIVFDIASQQFAIRLRPERKCLGHKEWFAGEYNYNGRWAVSLEIPRCAPFPEDTFYKRPKDEQLGAVIDGFMDEIRSALARSEPENTQVFGLRLVVDNTR